MKTPQIHSSIEWWTPSINVQKRDVKWVVESIVVHVLALALIFLFDRLFPHAIMVADESQTTIEIQVPAHFERQPAPIEESQGSKDGRAGPNVGSAASKAAAQSAKAAAISTGLSRIANSIAFSKVGDMAAGQTKVRSSDNVQTNQVMTGLSKMLGKNRGTDLSHSLTQVGSGSFAKGIRWDMFSSKKDGGMTAEEEREINRAFKGIDGEMRDCYEAAMLHDDALSVVMKMQVRVESGRFVNPQYELNGSATPAGESSLKGCINKVFQKYRVKSSISDLSVKFERIFK